MPRRFCKIIVILLSTLYAVKLIHLLYNSNKIRLEDLDRAKRKVNRLQKLLEKEREKIEELELEVNKLITTGEQGDIQAKKKLIGDWTEPIPVLVFVCNRSNAITNHIQKLIKYRPSSQEFPIVVSQDCDSTDVSDAVHAFNSSITYIKHPSSATAGVTAEPGRQNYLTYYSISRHYKLGLSYIFDKLNYSTVIITEDDLDIAPDFFEYFSATRKLLEADKTLFCVSAWNDNGKLELIDSSRTDTLYRSDFFPGLGWMMTRELWEEFGPQWPIGFWDDWVRDPLRRQNRSCIRPEISRTAMTDEGKKGASKGMFFKQHLRKIHLNTVPVNFNSLDLTYLLKDEYDDAFIERVYSSPAISFDEFVTQNDANRFARIYKLRIEYSTMDEYLEIADHLKIMRDFKAGVPRTAYMGVVTCFLRNLRIYVAPNRETWKGYNPGWEAPLGILFA